MLTLMANEKILDVLIVGAGVSGTSVFYLLSKFTNVKDVTLIEKCPEAGAVNSNKNNNSQTLHFGDIETNYSLEKAKWVNEAACLVKNYVEQSKDPNLFSKYHKIVLAVGKDQSKLLRERHKKFKKLFPKLKIILRKEIGKLEPLVLKDRLDSEEIVALYTEDGYTIDYGLLSKKFIEDACKNQKCEIYFSTKVKKITYDKQYTVETSKGIFKSKVLIVCAGSHSMIMAKDLGYGINCGILPVAGSFFGTKKKILNGKVYTLQLEKLPFAAIHGDPDVNNPEETRFGPTAKVLPLLERHNWSTIPDFLRTSVWSIAGVQSLFAILGDRIVRNYALKNFVYDIPIIGKHMFLKEVRKIVPSIKRSELIYRKGYGGIRPQIVDVNEKKLDMGEAKIEGKNAIFNITPSPGASTCLMNAQIDAKKIVSFLGKKYKFQEKKFKETLLCG